MCITIADNYVAYTRVLLVLIITWHTHVYH